MECPFCHKPMEPGHLNVMRSSPVWYPDDRKISGIDRFFGGIGTLLAPEKTWSQMIFPGHFCPTCKKMILDTDIIK